MKYRIEKKWKNPMACYPFFATPRLKGLVIRTMSAWIASCGWRRRKKTELLRASANTEAPAHRMERGRPFLIVEAAFWHFERRRETMVVVAWWRRSSIVYAGLRQEDHDGEPQSLLTGSDAPGGSHDRAR